MGSIGDGDDCLSTATSAFPQIHNAAMGDNARTMVPLNTGTASMAAKLKSFLITNPRFSEYIQVFKTGGIWFRRETTSKYEELEEKLSKYEKLEKKLSKYEELEKKLSKYEELEKKLRKYDELEMKLRQFEELRDEAS